MIWSVETQLPVSFEICRVDDVLSLDHIKSERKIIVIDQTVLDLYVHQLGKYDALLAIESTESRKNWKSVEKVLEFFEKEQILRRSEPVIAIGGGVLLDIVGFCCSIYRRGIPYIRVPTTLLAIVDASVGAKTGIDHFQRRNRLGSFYTPQEVLIDTSFIRTQESREISNGLAEILKLAIIKDQLLFELIEQDPKKLIRQKFQNNYLAYEIIDRAIKGMINELSNNLWEKELQRVVDFGHTFSPIVEMKNINNLLHGEAVILDCLLSCCISANRQLLSQGQLHRIFYLVRQCNLPTFHEDFLNLELLNTGLKDVTNHRDNNQYLPIPTKIGESKIINDVSQDELKQAVSIMERYGKEIENSNS